MTDIYLYEDVPVLRNKLEIKDEKMLDLIEAEQSRASMMLTLIVERHGYYMDQELMAASAGYVRDSFVMASLDQFSEYEHLERILLDAVCTEPIVYDEQILEKTDSQRTEKYQKYQKEKYRPQLHYKRED